MKAVSLSTLKKELNTLPHKDLLGLCIRLAKFKKENKEMISYLVFEAGNEAEYIENVKAELIVMFTEINRIHLYYTKKNIRKILRFLNKNIHYSGQKRTEIDLLIFFCQQLKASGIPIQKITALQNLYQSQIKKILKAVSTLHEDLQFDYQAEIKELTTFTSMS
ncbi:MAG: hypothetical protein CVT92_16470 [Bacteroidetes bacterium HGW-Bacteroidetes-1]|jgi:hypothetical protein|nr:MAG: hypothetical protein CVT92_16470 [Bacteroidetes bacterium HGW-Bacteroidetes-1]